MKIIKKTSILGIIAVAIVVLNGCKKEDPNAGNPTNRRTSAVFNPNKTYGTLTDQDGNVYKTITVGTQTWMAENLRTTKYRDGSKVPEVKSNDAWLAFNTDAYCNYNNTTSADTIATYGRLYNWLAVSDSRNLAPLGWHIPTNTEWSKLINYLGSSTVTGGKLKEEGSTHWLVQNGLSTNESGFTALPGGYRNRVGWFVCAGSNGIWWSINNERVDYNYWILFLESSSSRVEMYIDNGGFGNSVRCIKD